MPIMLADNWENFFNDNPINEDSNKTMAALFELFDAPKTPAECLQAAYISPPRYENRRYQDKPNRAFIRSCRNGQSGIPRTCDGGLPLHPLQLHSTCMDHPQDG